MLCPPTCATYGLNFLAKRAAPSWRCRMVNFLIAAFCRSFGLYTVVQERQCKVYMLFGKVALILTEPGLHFLWLRLGWKAPVVNWMGRCHTLDMRLDQEYLRSQPVNSEEGAPM